MKRIGKRGSGKTMFLLAFVSSLIENKIITYDQFWVYCPTYEMQSCGNKTLFAVKNMIDLVINEITQNKLLVFDYMQFDLKKSRRTAEIFTKGRHNRIGIIKCEKFTQDISRIEKANSGYIVLIPLFSLRSCE